MDIQLQPLQFSAEQVALLRQDLRPYTLEAVAELLGDVALAALDRDQRLPALRVARKSKSPLAVLIRLWMLGDTVPTEFLARALPHLGVAEAAQMGLLKPLADGQVVGLIDLRPIDGDVRQLWVGADRGEAASGAALDAEHVMGVGGASKTLAALTIRRHVRRALDLGTGSGIQFLLLAGHADELVATDLSPRALTFARFNAELNQVAVELREGSMVEPVAGEEFDLIVSNPPFVINPPTLEAHTYRTGSLPGDQLARNLLRALPAHLAPGGYAQLLLNWEVVADEDSFSSAQARLQSLLEPLGVWAWGIVRDVVDVAHYAETWLRDGGLAPERDRKQWERAYETYLTDFASRGTTHVAFGVVTLHRSHLPGPPWVRTEHLAATPSPGMGHHIAAVFTARTALAELSDEQLLAQHLIRASDVTEERFYTPGQSDPQVVLIRQGGGWGRSVQADTALAAVVGALDGDLSLGAICHAVAALLDVEPEYFISAIMGQIRALITDQFLLLPEHKG